MPLEDDDPDKWIYRPHTKAKHEVLSKYLVPWINKITTYNERSGNYNKIRVFDCFAGRGSYTASKNTDSIGLRHIVTRAETPGSPQIILDVLTERADQFAEAECVFIENDNNNYRQLEEILSEIEGLPSKINISTVNSKFEESVLEYVDKTGGSTYPGFFFIDPFGFKSLDYDVVNNIGNTRAFEFLISFMYRDMNRFLESEAHQEALNNVFGSDDWRDDLEGYDAENWEPLVEYYSNRLEENGPKHTLEYLISEPNTTQTIYYLVFGTNSGAGLKTMREVMATCGTGNFAYAPGQPEYDRKQITFGTGEESTEEFLLEHFSGFRIPYSDLVQRCSDLRKYATDTESDYRSALKVLESEGKIRIQRLTSKETGIKGRDLISFPYGDEFLDNVDQVNQNHSGLRIPEGRVQFDANSIRMVIASGESDRVEFKQSMPENARNIAKEVAAIGNHKGGILLIGVDDHGNVVGLDDVQDVEERVVHLVRDVIEPAMTPEILKSNISNKNVLIIQIPEFKDYPYSVNGTFYTRIGTTCQRMTGSDIVNLIS